MANLSPLLCAPRQLQRMPKTSRSLSTRCVCTPSLPWSFLFRKHLFHGAHSVSPICLVPPPLSLPYPPHRAHVYYPHPLTSARNQPKTIVVFLLLQDVKQSAAALAAKAVAEMRAKGGAAARKESKQREEYKQRTTEEAREAAKEAAASLRAEFALSVEERK